MVRVIWAATHPRRARKHDYRFMSDCAIGSTPYHRQVYTTIVKSNTFAIFCEQGRGRAIECQSGLQSAAVAVDASRRANVKRYQVEIKDEQGDVVAERWINADVLI